MCEHNTALLDENENTSVSPLYPHFWRKLSIGRQVVYELRRLIGHCDMHAIKFYEISFDHWVIRVPFRPGFLRPFFRYCLSSTAKMRDQVSN